MEPPVITRKHGRTAVIVAEADIERSPEDVFDYCSDHAHEPEWNIKMTGIEKLTDGPVGVGTRYQMEFTSGPPVISECVRFERPVMWEIVGRWKALTSGFRGRVAPRGDGAHLVLRMEIRLRGLLGSAAPLCDDGCDQNWSATSPPSRPCWNEGSGVPRTRPSKDEAHRSPRAHPSGLAWPCARAVRG